MHAARFATKLHAIYLTDTEIARASLDYPVVFARDADEQIVPVALVGVEPNNNLICDSNGRWPDGVYVPAYVRRYPFFMARLQTQESTDPVKHATQQPRSLILVDESGLEKNKSLLISADGQTTPLWSELEQLITQLDAHQRKTTAFCQKLDALGLFEKFDADFHPKPTSTEEIGSGSFSPRRINGLLRVKRPAIEALTDQTLASLVRDGAITVIDAHLNSFNRFDRLLNLYAATSTKSG